MASKSHKDIPDRIASLRREIAGPRGKARFAKALGISASTYDYYERGRVPPAEVLVKIAEVTGVDLYWLLTGKGQPGGGVAADNPVVQRAARLLADQPDAAAPLAAFLDVLNGVQQFPVSVAAASGAGKSEGSIRGGWTGAGDVAAVRRGWVPILGRTAAGVAQFWAEGEAEGVTMLDEIVARYASAPGASVQAAAAMEQGGATGETVQVVTLPSGADLVTAEFVAAEGLKARFPDAFGLRVDGESMAPEIRHGDIVMLSPSVPAADGRAAVVQLAGQIGVTCKLYRRVGEHVHLISIHEGYEVQTFPAAKIVWALAVLARVRL